jgi:hypothetical protein
MHHSQQAARSYVRGLEIRLKVSDVIFTVVYNYNILTQHAIIDSSAYL